MTVAEGKSLQTTASLLFQGTAYGRLYKSRLSRCSGVATSWDKTGTTICVTMVLEYG